MGPPALATDGNGKFLRPSDEVMLQFFERYGDITGCCAAPNFTLCIDLDGSGTMNSLSELRQLTTNLIVKLGLRIRVCSLTRIPSYPDVLAGWVQPDEIARLVEQQDENIDWDMGDFKAWCCFVLDSSYTDALCWAGFLRCWVSRHWSRLLFFFVAVLK